MESTATYDVFERIQVRRPVDRLAYLLDCARQKTILDLGCYDETALFKRGTGAWLHEELATVAREVIGLDNSTKIPDEGIVTSSTSRILRADVHHMPEDVDYDRVDMIVAGEIIEHIPDTLSVLTAIAENPRLRSKVLLVTTPNATTFPNVVLGMISRESQHPDHLQVYSYKTLRSLIRRAGFLSFELIPYHARYAELLYRSRGVELAVTRSFQALTWAVETAFPLLCGGWIARIDT